ncbi:MAG: hypothetical protein ABJG41_12015 [Cyclobacteriaceae bacterium]
MKKDIKIPKIEDVLVAVAKDGDSWRVYLLNRNANKLETVMVTSKGYGKKEGEEQKTSVLRHMIPHLESGEYALIESIDPQVFHLNNEYWVSFFIDGQLYDKKYIFVPDSIVKENLSFIPELEMEGVLHE